ncbi:TPA: 2-pyrone-4,6-dicarboxylate hydrolase, partial [Legionella pneumophila]|nr:2-pyrone-4,6-dicarboxylate hydrolase [Legionella pneumophila]
QDLFDEKLTEKILYRNARNFYSKNSSE